MDLAVLLARVLHVVGGVFWAGAMIFNAAFLLPAMVEAGPEGAKVAAGLMRRRFVDVMPVVALLTVLSGFYLYWRASAGDPAFMGSAVGMIYGVGAVAALVALGIGIAVVRPSIVQATALSQSAAGLEPAARDKALADAQALRQRVGSAGRLVAWLWAVAAVSMAVARYL